jgi:hypothetical protein
LFGQPTLNSRNTRWLEFLSEYDFEIKHIKGKQNQVVDEFRMRSYQRHIAAINIHMMDLNDHIIATSNSDQRYLKIKETLQQYNFQHKFNFYELKEDGILMYKRKSYVLNSNKLKNAVIKEMHNVPYVGHL